MVELVDTLERKVAALEEEGSDPEAVLALNAWVNELRDAQERARSDRTPDTLSSQPPPGERMKAASPGQTVEDENLSQNFH